MDIFWRVSFNLPQTIGRSRGFPPRTLTNLCAQRWLLWVCRTPRGVLSLSLSCPQARLEDQGFDAWESTLQMKPDGNWKMKTPTPSLLRWHNFGEHSTLSLSSPMDWALAATMGGHLGSAHFPLSFLPCLPYPSPATLPRMASTLTPTVTPLPQGYFWTETTWDRPHVLTLGFNCSSRKHRPQGSYAIYFSTARACWIEF